jgi:chromosome segregation ATPase
MENGDETFASPTAAAAEFEFDFGPELTNGSGGHTANSKAAAAYDVGEMDALREAKQDLEEKLAAARHENGFLSAEAARLELQVSKAREDIAAAERAATDAEGQAAGLRAEVKRLQGLVAAADAPDRDGPALGGVLATAHQEKLALEEEIKALKASASSAAADEEEEETAAPSTKDCLVASHGMVAAAAAAGAAVTAAIAVVLLRLKR